MHLPTVLCVTVPLLALLPQQSRPASMPDLASMRSWQLVLMKPTGPMPKDAPLADHLKFLEQLLKDRKAAALGPFAGGKDYAGVLILDVASPVEARALMAEEPFVKAGHMELEIHSWLGPKAGFGPAADGVKDRVECVFGMLRRAKDVPEKTQQELEQIQRGHLEHIMGMVQTGDLAAAGPLLDNGPIRGLLLFRITDQKRIRELVAQDPMVKAGRLTLDLYQWSVPRGCIPEPAPAKK
jgi:uncharacterized protein YciI